MEWLFCAVKKWQSNVMAGKRMLLQGAVVPDDFIRKVFMVPVALAA